MAFIVPPGFGYVALKLGVWMVGGVSVPLGIAHSPREIEYVIGDSGAGTVIFHPDLGRKLEGGFLLPAECGYESSRMFCGLPTENFHSSAKKEGR